MGRSYTILGRDSASQRRLSLPCLKRELKIDTVTAQFEWNLNRCGGRREWGSDLHDEPSESAQLERLSLSGQWQTRTANKVI